MSDGVKLDGKRRDTTKTRHQTQQHEWQKKRTLCSLQSLSYSSSSVIPLPAPERRKQEGAQHVMTRVSDLRAISTSTSIELELIVLYIEENYSLPCTP